MSESFCLYLGRAHSHTHSAVNIADSMSFVAFSVIFGQSPRRGVKQREKKTSYYPCIDLDPGGSFHGKYLRFYFSRGITEGTTVTVVQAAAKFSYYVSRAFSHSTLRVTIK